MIVGHYTGNIESATKRANEKTRGRDGAFYKILTKHGFYDIDDTDNGLKPEQRAGVPEYNKRRMSQLASAISDMFTDFLTNSDYGVLVPCIEKIINQMDVRDSMTTAEVDVIGSSMNAIPGGSAIDGSRQAISTLVASAMGFNKFNPNMIPPISIGFGGLPISISNVYKEGMFQPNWEFLYAHEPVKSSKFYAGPDGSVYLSAGIPLNLGGMVRALVLKTIFSVPTIDKDGQAQGDIKGGISAEQFDIVYAVSDRQFTSLTDEELEFELSEEQMRLAYYKYISLVLWGSILNVNNWAHLHWGALTHNSCPTSVKTALCSYLQTAGLAIDPAINPISGLLSYCLNTGLAYITGRDKPVGFIALKGMKYLKGKTVTICDGSQVSWTVSEDGVPKDYALARQHFVMIADILSHITPGEVDGEIDIRRRRVDEANLIYGEFNMPKIDFGKKPSSQPKEMQGDKVANRGLKKLIGVDFMVYPNECPTAGNVNNVDIRIMADNQETFDDKLKDTLGGIASTAGVPGMVVTSLWRSDEDQAKQMFKNMLNQNFCSYGPRGRQVQDVYNNEWKKLHPGEPVGRLDESAQAKTQQLMIDKAKEIYAKTGKHVSNHTSDPNEKVAIDIGPNSTRTTFKYSSDQMQKIHNAFRDALSDGYISYYLGPAQYGPPKDDPAMHWEIYTDNRYKKYPGVFSGNYEDLLPSVNCRVADMTMSNSYSLDSVLQRDYILVAESESEDSSIVSKIKGALGA